MSVKKELSLDIERVPPATRTVDANITGICPLKCSFCWGPEHEMGALIDTDGWKSILTNFANNGTEAIVFTGGSPLSRKDAVELLRHAKEDLGLQITLSATGVYHDRLREAVKYIDEIGIPVDGSTADLNSRMRLNDGVGHFGQAIEAMGIVKELRPDVRLTVRTVVSRVNYDDVEAIGYLINDLPFEVDRWKLYQFTPTGAYGSIDPEEHLVADSRFQEIVESMTDMFPNLNVESLSTAGRRGRYFFVMPNGSASGVFDGSGYVGYGNVVDDFDGVLVRANTDQ